MPRRRPALKKHIAQLLAGTRDPNHPEPGFFRLKKVKKGPWVPARIWLCDHEPGNPENLLDTGSFLMATIGNDTVDPLVVWQWGYRIDEQEYLWRLADGEWAERHGAPDDPVANPRAPVDLSKHPSLF